jgi:hypothetical protein
MEWRHTRRWETWPYVAELESCTDCGAAAHRFDDLPEQYTYLLGMYLGDGHINTGGKGCTA